MKSTIMLLFNVRTCCKHDKLFKHVRYCTTFLQKEKETLRHKENIENRANDNWSSAKPFDAIPGPKPVPIFGNIWRYMPYIGNYAGLSQHDINRMDNEQYGDIVRQTGLIFREDMILLYNPKDIETVGRFEGPLPKRDVLPSISYYRTKMRPEYFEGYGGIFTVDGEEWHQARSKINPILMNPRTVKLHAGVVEQVSDDMVNMIKHLIQKSPDGEMADDFSSEFYKWGLESITALALNIRLGLLNPNEEPNIEAKEFLLANLNFFDHLYKLDILPSPWKYISTPTWRKYVRDMDIMTKFIHKQVDKGMQNLEENKMVSKSDYELTILEKLIKLGKKTMFATIMDMLTGGVDTTARTIHAWMYYISSNQEAQRKLREEIKSVLPTLDTPVTPQELEKMPYLRATIKETMRMAPISLGTMRYTSRDLVLSGFQIPKGTHVMFCNLTLSFKEEQFSQANKFLPERWLRNDGIRTTDINPWVYQPFGFGPRACVGKRLANLELEIFLAKIIRNFEMEWHHEEMKFKSNLLYGIADPLKIKMKIVDE